MQVQGNERQRLEPRSETRLRLADPLCDCTDASPFAGVQVEDPVGLAEPKGAQNDGLGGVGPRHASSLERPSTESEKGVSTLEQREADSPLHDSLVRLLRAGEGAAPFAGACV